MLLPFVAALALQSGPFVQTLSPGTTYDPSIPTLEAFAGHDFHEEITPPATVTGYIRALANASELAHLIEYGETYEGRPLVALLIASAERIDGLESVAAGMQALGNPDRTPEDELERLIDEMPVVTALVHGVHGDEISSSGAAMATAYHLLAARNNPARDRILSESLVLIDPMQNPDGRARFVASNRQARAASPSDHPAAAALNQPWPGGRYNHYLFDMNRDWFAHTQPETRGRAELFLRFRPQIVVDLHEMGSNSTYYFAPAALPLNPYFPDEQTEWWDVLGRSIADAFDERGFQYFTRDVYDGYYPGYGDSWPMLHGAIGMTFEQASAEGLAIQRNDGTVLTYGNGVHHHWTSSMQTLQTASENREALLRYYTDYARSAMEIAGPAEYVLHSAHDPALANRLARLLTTNGIRVGRTTEAMEVDGRSIAAGDAYVVPAAQPAGRLIRNLLEDHIQMDPDFVAEQVRRRADRLRPEIYDVTAWSLPRMWDVEAIPLDRASGVATAPLADADSGSPISLPEARVGYLVPWNTAGAAAIAEALGEGLMVRAAGESLVLEGREYGVGTAIVRRSDNEEGYSRRLAEIVARHGAEAIPVQNSFVDSGMSLGSNSVRALREPRVMLAWDSPSSPMSTGWAWYTLEQRYGMRVTPVRTASMVRADLSEWDVIVLPAGGYGGVFGDSFVDDLRGWLSEGGTLVTMASSSEWAARAGLLDATTERRGGAPSSEDAPDRPTQDQPIDYFEAITPASESPEQTTGAILNVDLDTTHWLASGTDGRIGAMVEGNRIFSPMTLGEGTNVGIYAGPEGLVVGGIVWDEALPQLPYKAFLMHQGVGQGQIVAFAQDPNYRAYTEATSLLFINAVLLGPGR